MGAALLAMLVCGLAEEAASLEGAQSPEPLGAAYRGAMEPEENIEKRPTPQTLAGRAPEPEGAALLLWGPRVLFFPVHLVMEYVVRHPLEFLAESFERYHIGEWYNHLTTWDGGNGRVFPIFALPSGFSGKLGIGAVWTNALFDGQDLLAGADSDFDRNVTVNAAVRFRFLPKDALKVTAGFHIEQRDDFVFFGQGAATNEGDQSRFFRDKMRIAVETELDRVSYFDARLGVEYSSNAFDCASASSAFDICGPDAQQETADDLFRLNDPQGAAFFRGYKLIRLKAALAADSRTDLLRSETGVRLEGILRYGKGLGGRSKSIQFVRYGGELSAFWDVVPGYRRVFGARVRIEMTDPIADGDLPFAELITSGGPEHMRGFLRARFHGRSLAVATIDYRYPVWTYLDGTLFYEVGNVFGERLEDFRGGLLRQSFGLGLRSLSTTSSSLSMLLAFSTTRFEQDFKIEAVRFSVGTNWGF